MHLEEFTCSSFRVLGAVRFQPAPGINIIRGNNAQGKSSLLEAIHYLATSKSHRTNTESDLLQYGAEGFHLSARVQRRDRTVCVEAHWRQNAKRFKVNGIPQTRLSDILGKVHVVLFSPEDVALARGSATHRRRFLDMELSQLSPGYLTALQQYRLILRQRNELLRAPEPDKTLLDAWDEQLARHGSTLIKQRSEFALELARLAAASHARLAHHESLVVRYQADVNPEESLRAVLAQARPSDIKRGMTTRGPHRDDLELLLDDRPARNFASQGQQKTIALALRLALLEVVKDAVGEYPILMLDEVLSELDELRAGQLFGAIEPSVQCLLTTTEMTNGHIPHDMPCAQFVMEQGCLEKQ